MEDCCGLPDYFPLRWNRRLAGLDYDDSRKKKFSVVFQDFGSLGHVDVNCQDSDPVWKPECLMQRQGKESATLSSSQIPALPLSETPVKVNYPYKDKVIKDLHLTAGKVARFKQSLASATAAVTERRQAALVTKRFKTAKRTLDVFTDPYKLPVIRRQTIESNLPKSITDLIPQYQDLSTRDYFGNYSSYYSGGSLSCVVPYGDSTVHNRHLLVHSTGCHLDRLTFTLAQPSVNPGRMTSRSLAQIDQPRIYQVSSQQVGDNVYVGLRHKNSCSLFTVTNLWGHFSADDSDQDDGVEERKALPSQIQPTSLGVHQFSLGTVATSVSVSPYLAGECLFCNDNSMVYLWSAERGAERTVSNRLPRFDCSDTWLQAYYGSHPRHVVVADRTAVQMMDHRDGFRSSVDLFALPSSCVHPKERVVAAAHLGDESQLHLVSTGHSVMVIDQRFAGTPVMQWYPDTKGPVVYMGSTPCQGSSSDSTDSNMLVLLGSQYPAEVICYPLSHGPGQPVTTPSPPCRLSRMSDITDACDGSVLNCIDCAVMKQRLSISLVGVTAAPASKSGPLVTYQMDCFGELFYQTHTPPGSVPSSSPQRIQGEEESSQPVTTQKEMSQTARKIIRQRLAASENIESSSKSRDTTEPHQPHITTESASLTTNASGQVALPWWVQHHIRVWAKRLLKQFDSLHHTPASPHVRNRVKPWSFREALDDTSKTKDLLKRFKRRKTEARRAPLPESDLSQSSDATSEDNSCVFCQSNECMNSDKTEENLLSSFMDISEDALDDVTLQQSLELLNRIATAPESYKPDASTNVHLWLMGKEVADGTGALMDLVKQREEERTQLLEKYKQMCRERRKRKRDYVDEENEDSVGLDPGSQGQEGSITRVNPQQTVQAHPHSVFNSEEHQRQNELIDQMLGAAKLDPPKTLRENTSDEESVSDKDSENTPPSDKNSMDLFDSADESKTGLVDAADESKTGLVDAQSQDDDDEEFFSFHDEYKPSQSLRAPPSLSQSLTQSVLSPVSKQKTDRH